MPDQNIPAIKYIHNNIALIAPFQSPFLKWAGGKKYLLPQLAPFIPSDFGTYYEPFMGGAALFFALQPKRAKISDVNPKLVETFEVVRDRVEELIIKLSAMPIEKEYYYQIRAASLSTPLERAARFIYLNKTCWNGLYRENRKGEFNVPFGLRGQHASSEVAEPQKLRLASASLKNTDIRTMSFASSVARAREGDFIYFDPPYTVSHNDNGFIEYNSSIFSWNDQIRLRDAAVRLRKKGCHIIISNADHAAIHELYKGFNINIIERSSSIASDKTKRRRVTEVVITND